LLVAWDCTPVVGNPCGQWMDPWGTASVPGMVWLVREGYIQVRLDALSPVFSSRFYSVHYSRRKTCTSIVTQIHLYMPLLLQYIQAVNLLKLFSDLIDLLRGYRQTDGEILIGPLQVCECA
jgi:hypothetical protein